MLNGIRDFVDGQSEIADTTGSLTEFLEDIALATDFDNEKKDDIDRVYLMTVHLSKGLEFPVVYIVGLEEDLFPSALSMNTRNELEEERRLFYVALTRAEEKAIITYASCRYRWGKLVDAEPSRFIEEIDDKYLDFLIPKESYVFKPLIDTGIFNETNNLKSKSSTLKADTKINTIPSQKQLGKLKEIKSNQKTPVASIDQAIRDLQEGMNVEHKRFGYGKVLKIDGLGNDRRATINFDIGGEKNYYFVLQS